VENLFDEAENIHRHLWRIGTGAWRASNKRFARGLISFQLDAAWQHISIYCFRGLFIACVS